MEVSQSEEYRKKHENLSLNNSQKKTPNIWRDIVWLHLKKIYF